MPGCDLDRLSHVGALDQSLEGTRHYGLGLARYLASQGEQVAGIDAARHVGKRRAGKSDPIDAIRAARELLARPHLGQMRTDGDRFRWPRIERAAGDSAGRGAQRGGRARRTGVFVDAETRERPGGNGVPEIATKARLTCLTARHAHARRGRPARAATHRAPCRIFVSLWSGNNRSAHAQIVQFGAGTGDERQPGYPGIRASGVSGSTCGVARSADVRCSDTVAGRRRAGASKRSRRGAPYCQRRPILTPRARWSQCARACRR